MGKIVARQVGETAAESRIEFSERFRPLQTGMLNRAHCFVQFISLISRDKLHETLHIFINGALNSNMSAAWKFSYENIMFCSLVEWLTTKIDVTAVPTFLRVLERKEVEQLQCHQLWRREMAAFMI